MDLLDLMDGLLSGHILEEADAADESLLSQDDDNHSQDPTVFTDINEELYEED